MLCLCFHCPTGMQPAVRADVLGALRELLEDENVRKVGWEQRVHWGVELLALR